MCEFFVKADPILYESRSRTVRIHGVLTSIRLENMCWDTLSEMADEEGCTTNSLISQFHDEILAQRGEVPNFASFLRVTCMRYLRRRIEGVGVQERRPPLEVARSAAVQPIGRRDASAAQLLSGVDRRAVTDHRDGEFMRSTSTSSDRATVPG